MEIKKIIFLIIFTLPIIVQANEVEIVATKPSAPAKLKLGERLVVDFKYNIQTKGKFWIWVRPYRKNSGPGDYLASGSFEYSSPKGIGSGFFFYQYPIKIDGIRVTVMDRKKTKKLFEKYYPYVYEWAN